MIKILGVLDIIASILLFIAPSNLSIPERLIWTFALYLVIKGAVFVLSIVSVVDIIGGVMLLISLTSITIPKTIFFVVAFIIAQKGIFSLLADG